MSLHLYNLATIDTTVQVSVITSIGLVVVSLVGVLTAKVTSGARKDAQTNAIAASKSADIARDYVAALDAKDALVKSLEGRIQFLEERNEACDRRIAELEIRLAENEEQQRAAAIIEREQHRELEDLRARVSQHSSKRRMGS